MWSGGRGLARFCGLRWSRRAAIPPIKPLLKLAGHSIAPAATPLTTLASLTAYGSAHGITLTPKTKPAR